MLEEEEYKYLENILSLLETVENLLRVLYSK